MPAPAPLPFPDVLQQLARLRRLAAGYTITEMWCGNRDGWRFSAQATSLDRHPYAVVSRSAAELADAIIPAA